tara:strand:+ start:5728 stop:6117 length:390 start_codon:yes stop_codon:yes gene_type:complete
MYGIAPKLPLNINKVEGFQATRTIEENTQQNLKHLILTAPGEKVMDPEFGVGLRNYLFDQGSSTTLARLESAIIEQVSIYMPFVQIQLVEVGMTEAQNENLMQVKLTYSIAGISTDEILNLSIDPKFNR